MKSMLIDSTDPTLNLAIEETLLQQAMASDETQDDNKGVFLLWQNAPSIIVGRHQNTRQEVNEKLVARHSLPVVRRMTGGGAVYHDLGNVNFSFIVPASSVPASDRGMNFQHFLQPILETLHDFDIPATFSSRNDVTCHGRKISGSAQLRRRNTILHHGTLLVSLDLDMLGAVLTGAPDKYVSKGIDSIRSRVANLQEFLPAHMTVDTALDALKSALVARCASHTMELDADILHRAEKLAQEKYRTEAWNYGASPPFTEKRRERFAWGLVECQIDVVKGRIRHISILGDFFAQKDVSELERALTDIPYTSEGVQRALAQIAFEEYFSGCEPEIMRHFFCDF